MSKLAKAIGEAISDKTEADMALLELRRLINGDAVDYTKAEMVAAIECCESTILELRRIIETFPD